MTIDEIRILLKVNGAATYTHTINEVTNVTNNYTNSVGNLVSTLAKLVSAGAIVKFGKQCIQAASDLQEVANVVDVTFGKSADLVNNWAKNQAASFGLSETAAKRYVGTYGTMAKQFNMTTQQAAAMGIELTKLTGDVASFYNIDSQAAATKLKSVFTGETESLKELGVVMTETQLNAYAMSKGFNKKVKEMSEQEKVMLRYQFTMEKLAHAQGDFARTSDSYANSTRSLSLELENLKIEVGKELLPVVAMGTQALSRAIQAIAPTLISIAQTIRLYAQAWKNASETTKTFAKVALVAIGVMLVIPNVVRILTKAYKILFVQTVTLTTAMQALAGVIGIILAAAAFSELSKEVDKLRQSEANLGDTAEVSTDATEDLADALDGLGDSSKGLETFLASFDEVNKVGGSSSLMSSLVTADDLNNILGASLGIEDLQNQLDGLNQISLGGIFSKDFWSDLGKGVMGFIDTFGTDEFWENWKLGAQDVKKALESFDEWLKQHFPEWQALFDSVGQSLYDMTHNKEGKATTVGSIVMDKMLGANEKDNSESFTMNGVTYAKYGANGQLSSAYENYIRGNVNKTASVTNNNNTTRTENINLLIDGQKITSVVVDGINAITRSSGNSPLVE